MSQNEQIKFATKPEDLSSIHRIHTVEGETNSQVHMYTYTSKQSKAVNVENKIIDLQAV